MGSAERNHLLSQATIMIFRNAITWVGHDLQELNLERSDFRSPQSTLQDALTSLRSLDEQTMRIIPSIREAPTYVPGMNKSVNPEFELKISPAARQNRWTVFFRGFMVFPHTIVLMFLLVAAEVLTFLAWFAILFTGRNPFHHYVSNVIRWSARVNAYTFLLTDQYPPFTLSGDTGYPVTTALEAGWMSRVTVFFRLILVIPAGFVSAALTVGMELVLIVAWFATLIRGTLPESIHNAFGATIRFQTRVTAYTWLVQDRYPRGLFGDGHGESLTGDVIAPSSPTEFSENQGETVHENAPAEASESNDAAAGSTPLNAGFALSSVVPDQIPIQPFGEWELAVTKSGRRVLVTELIAGSVGYVALIVVYIVLIASMIHTISQGSAWSSTYRSDIVTLRSTGITAMNSINPSAPNWSAISTACSTTNNVVASFKTIPQYPVAGPNKHLLEGFGLIALAAKDCSATIAPKKITSQLPALEKVFNQGAAQLQTFLSQS